MRYERMQDPFVGLKCFRKMSKFIEQFSELAKDEITARPDIYFNLGGMMACVLYARAHQDLTWVAPFIDGVNSFMNDMSKTHVEKSPLISVFQHPDVPQA